METLLVTYHLISLTHATETTYVGTPARDPFRPYSLRTRNESEEGSVAAISSIDCLFTARCCILARFLTEHNVRFVVPPKMVASVVFVDIAKRHYFRLPLLTKIT